MLSSLTDPNILLGGLILALVQMVASIPWLRAIDPRGFDRALRDPNTVLSALGTFVGVGVFIALFLGYKGDSSSFQIIGRIYGGVLHLQLLIDLFIIGPYLLTGIFPKAGAVASAAYREAWRQPMFWLILLAGFLATWISVVIPYFTFGDDFKMMKQIGFDIVMLTAVLFGVLASSMSISEEIEGRTALTVMSKPVNRRQFLLGKYLGILMACGGMTLILGLNLNAALVVNPEFDPINKDRAYDAMPEEAKRLVTPFQKLMPPGPARTIANGALMWAGENFAHGFGLMLGFGQVMILVAITTALATRLPFIINLVICLMIYFLGHLAPVIVRVTDKATDKENTAVGLVRFLGNLFDTLLPALEFFNMGPAIIRETPLDLWQFATYAVTVTAYAVLYTVIALIVGLLLFEDRDLA